MADSKEVFNVPETLSSMDVDWLNEIDTTLSEMRYMQTSQLIPDMCNASILPNFSQNHQYGVFEDTSVTESDYDDNSVLVEFYSNITNDRDITSHKDNTFWTDDTNVLDDKFAHSLDENKQVIPNFLTVSNLSNEDFFVLRNGCYEKIVSVSVNDSQCEPGVSSDDDSIFKDDNDKVINQSKYEQNFIVKQSPLEGTLITNDSKCCDDSLTVNIFQQEDYCTFKNSEFEDCMVMKSFSICEGDLSVNDNLEDCGNVNNFKSDDISTINHFMADGRFAMNHSKLEETSTSNYFVHDDTLDLHMQKSIAPLSHNDLDILETDEKSSDMISTSILGDFEDAILIDKGMKNDDLISCDDLLKADELSYYHEDNPKHSLKYESARQVESNINIDSSLTTFPSQLGPAYISCSGNISDTKPPNVKSHEPMNLGTNRPNDNGHEGFLDFFAQAENSPEHINLDTFLPVTDNNSLSNGFLSSDINEFEQMSAFTQEILSSKDTSYESLLQEESFSKNSDFDSCDQQEKYLEQNSNLPTTKTSFWSAQDYDILSKPFKSLDSFFPLNNDTIQNNNLSLCKSHSQEGFEKGLSNTSNYQETLSSLSNHWENMKNLDNVVGKSCSRTIQSEKKISVLDSSFLENSFVGKDKKDKLITEKMHLYADKGAKSQQEKLSTYSGLPGKLVIERENLRVNGSENDSITTSKFIFPHTLKENLNISTENKNNSLSEASKEDQIQMQSFYTSLSSDYSLSSVRKSCNKDKKDLLLVNPVKNQHSATTTSLNLLKVVETIEKPVHCICPRVNVGMKDKFVSLRVRDMWYKTIKDLLHLSGHASSPKSEKDIAMEMRAERTLLLKRKAKRLKCKV